MAHRNKISAYDGLTVTGAVAECGTFALSEGLDRAKIAALRRQLAMLLRRPL